VPKEKDEEGVEPSSFTSKRVKNERGGVEPSRSHPNTSKMNGEGVEPSSFASKHIEYERGGVEPSSFASKHV